MPEPQPFLHSLPLPPRLRPQTPVSGLSGCVRVGTLWSPALGASSLASRTLCSSVRRPAGRGARREGGGAGRLVVSDPPEPRETGASCVTARRPPCQQAGLETDPAPAGSPCVASDAQVRRAARLRGISRLAAAAELRTVARSSRGAVLRGSCSGSLRIRPLAAPRFSPLFAGMLLSRIAPISPRALASPGILRLPLRVGVSARWPVVA